MASNARVAGWISLSLAIGAGVWSVSNLRNSSTALAAMGDLNRYLFQSTENVTLTHLGNAMQVRDPVYLQRDNGSMTQVGYVLEVDHESEPNRTVVRWYDDEVGALDCEMTAQQNSGRVEDLFEMMFPPEKRRRIDLLIKDAMRQHGQQISLRLIPIFERAMRDSLPAIEAGFRASVAAHRDELDALAVRWNAEIVEQRLLPLAKNEIVPIVRKNAEPIAQVIGRELWDRASIWSFTWRALYDKTPLPRKDLMKQEWERFVEQEAIPVLESHAGELATAIQATMLEVSQSKIVRAEIAEAADMIAKDPKARTLVQAILRETIMENLELRKIWADAWTSPEATAALEESASALEPTIRKIGDEMMGTRDKGIDPGFAKLIRNQVLQKDKRWILATPIR